MVTRAGHHRAHMCVEVGGDRWSSSPLSACGGFASRAPMTGRHVVVTGGFQRGGVPADGHPSRGATNRASHENGLHRHIEIDEHGWFQENARDSPTPHTQPMRAERGSTAFAGSGKGQHGFIVLVRGRQTLKGLRTDSHHGDRPSAADADNNRARRLKLGARRRFSTLGSGRPTAGLGADTHRCPGGASRGGASRSPGGSATALAR